MKKQFLNLFLGLAVVAVSLSSCSKKSEDGGSTDPKTTTEFLASTTPSNRVALLEDFTGVRCGFCPDGHVKAKAVADKYPGKFIILAVHESGSYSQPTAGWMNFQTTFAKPINTQAKISGYPAGSISRFPASTLGQTAQISGGMAMSRSAWDAATAKVIAMPAPVNIGTKATFDAATRLLTVKVDMYYTSDESANINNVNVWLLQDKIISKQSGGLPDANAYEQNHVVRDMLTGTWGEAISDSKAIGSKVTKTYTYTVPEYYNGTTADGGGAVVVSNLKVVTFVAKGQTEILNAVSVPVK